MATTSPPSAPKGLAEEWGRLCPATGALCFKDAFDFFAEHAKKGGLFAQRADSFHAEVAAEKSRQDGTTGLGANVPLAATSEELQGRVRSLELLVVTCAPYLWSCLLSVQGCLRAALNSKASNNLVGKPEYSRCNTGAAAEAEEDNVDEETHQKEQAENFRSMRNFDAHLSMSLGHSAR
jgi:hypothetical protein